MSTKPPLDVLRARVTRLRTECARLKRLVAKYKRERDAARACRWIGCRTCGGTGGVADRGDVLTCDRCNGSGAVKET